MASEVARRKNCFFKPQISESRADVSLYPDAMEHHTCRGFTLIELLVVISIIVFLIALLIPTAQRVRRQGRAVVCQSSLHQWSVAFYMYVNDFGGRLPNHFPGGASNHIWPYALDSYFADCNDLLMCPMAVRQRIRPDDPFSTTNSMLRITGGKFATWEYKFDFEPWKTHFSGSYGINGKVNFFRVDDPHARAPPSTVPILLDCAYMDARPWPFDNPPEYDDQIDRRFDIKYFCINRHDGGINSLFLDWSVRRVGLKELWTLPWDFHYPAWMVSHGPWTKAGGVQPEDWPQWMRSFKDY